MKEVSLSSRLGNRVLQKRHIKRHMDSVHKENKPFGCTTCGASFTQNAQLKVHWELVHESSVNT